MKSRYTHSTKLLISADVLTLVVFIVFAFRDTAYASTYIVLSILLLYHLKSLADRVDITEYGITVRNWFIMETRTYELDQFDDLVQYIDPIETIGRNDIFLLKNKTIFCRIRGRNYSNTKELIDCIGKLKKTGQ